MFERLTASQRKLLSWVGLLAAVGIGLMLLQSPSLQPPRADSDSSQSQQSLSVGSFSSGQGYAAEIEERLSHTLAQIAGVGAVEVFVTLERSSRVVVAESLSEENRDGETRLTRAPIVLRAGSQASDVPLVLESYEPQLRGVLIVAAGADNPHIRHQIFKAAQTVLQLPAYKIEVLAKSKEKR
ncbi:MAG: hypothetical protein GX228_08150 [Firmicutes bacterium]|nr:hypothetical protein [Bacillota bacterium]NLL88883.1 hypothetical protein [Bacillota bacterium]